MIIKFWRHREEGKRVHKIISVTETGVYESEKGLREKIWKMFLARHNNSQGKRWEARPEDGEVWNMIWIPMITL